MDSRKGSHHGYRAYLRTKIFGNKNEQEVSKSSMDISDNMETKSVTRKATKEHVMAPPTKRLKREQRQVWHYECVAQRYKHLTLGTAALLPTPWYEHTLPFGGETQAMDCTPAKAVDSDAPKLMAPVVAKTMPPQQAEWCCMEDLSASLETLVGEMFCFILNIFIVLYVHVHDDLSFVCCSMKCVQSCLCVSVWLVGSKEI